jgi:DNA polymerase III alpha subunit
MGLTILPLDINPSEWAYRGIGMTLCLGFMQLKGLERAFVTRLLEERQRHGRYRSFHDFLTRLNPEPAQTRLLILAGCFDTIAGEVTRPGLLWRLYANHPITGLSSQQSALRHATPLLTTAPTLPIPNDYAIERKIQHEIQLLGFPLQCHPLTLYEQHWRTMNIIPATSMATHIGKPITMVGWLITEKPAVTKHGESMVFLTLEDTTGLYDATLFPNVFEQYGPLLTNERPLVLKGKVEEEFGAVTFTVAQLQIVGQEDRQEVST